MSEDTEALFEEIREFPDPKAAASLERLVGLDEIRARLLKEAQVLLQPGRLNDWSKRHYGRRVALLDSFADRFPLFIFAGDVGTGKTALAESIGEPIARAEDIPLTLFRLSLNVRGSGAVGEMTKLLTKAFAYVREKGLRAANPRGKPAAGFILLIDEADAVAQSRDLAQMHHEDRAGVNAFIRGVDSLAAEGIPAIVILCTNRFGAIDPAVRRRAAEIFEFRRPNDAQRLEVLRRALEDAGFSSAEIDELAKATGPTDSTPGFTYSDLRQRLLPDILLDAFPDRRVDFARALEIAKGMKPTPAFQGDGNTSV
jgi:AAA+ superfamily predicted ATPase